MKTQPRATQTRTIRAMWAHGAFIAQLFVSWHQYRNGQNGSMTLFYLIASSCFLLSCCVLSYTMPTQQLGSRGFFKRMSSDHFRDATLAGKTDTLEASSFSALASMGSYLLASCLSGHLPLGILPPGVCLLRVAGLWVATCWVAAVWVATC